MTLGTRALYPSLCSHHKPSKLVSSQSAWFHMASCWTPSSCALPPPFLYFWKQGNRVFPLCIRKASFPWPFVILLPSSREHPTGLMIPFPGSKQLPSWVESGSCCLVLLFSDFWCAIGLVYQNHQGQYFSKVPLIKTHFLSTVFCWGQWVFCQHF